LVLAGFKSILYARSAIHTRVQPGHSAGRLANFYSLKQKKYLVWCNATISCFCENLLKACDWSSRRKLL